MNLLTPELRDALRTNDIARRAAFDARRAEPDPAPVVKFFSPVGAATWLATELYDDDDTLFGLADLGFGCPELGTFSLSELASVHLPFGLGIERDLAFATPFALSLWADTARRAGSIFHAQPILYAAARAGDAPELPPDGG